MLEEKSNSSFNSISKQQQLNQNNQQTPFEANTLSNLDALISTIHTSFAEVQSSTQDLLEFKDTLLTHFLPPPLLIRLTCLFSRLYRSFSDLNPPVNELLRLTKLYSSPWSKQTAVMQRLYREGEQKRALLNLAIRRLAIAERRTKGWEHEHRVLNWERLYIRLSEAKGHARRWRFRVEGVRKKVADEGYDELIRWLNSKDGQIAEEEEEEGEEEDEEGEDGFGDENEDGEEEREELGDDLEERTEAEISRRKAKLRGDGRRNKRGLMNMKDKKEKKEKFDDELSNLSLDLDGKSEEELELKEKKKKATADGEENDMIEVDSDQELFSDVSSTIQTKKKPEEPKEVAFANTQTEPDVESKSTWTGEPNYKKYFILRLFKPAEFNSKRVKFKVKYDNQSFVSRVFDVTKKVKISDQNIRRPGGFKGSNDKKDEKPESDIKIETNKFQDFLFEINDSFRNKGDLDEAINDKNSIKFEMSIEEDNENVIDCVIRMDDIYTLDLPILYFKTNENAKVIDYYDSQEEEEEPKKGSKEERRKSETAKGWARVQEMTNESAANYELLSRRPPFTFDMNKPKNDSTKPACKLPVMFFWLNKPDEIVHHKNTGTQSVNDIIKNMIGIDLSKGERINLENVKETLDKSSSPIFASYVPLKPPSTPQDSSSLKPKVTWDPTQVKQSEDLEYIHDTYQTQINELNYTILRLEDEISQLKTFSELKTAMNKNRAGLAKDRSNFYSRMQEKMMREKSSELSAKRSYQQQQQQQQQPEKKPQVYDSEFEEKFLQRLKFFSERSNIHQKELLQKYANHEANMIEKQMAVQHRLDTAQTSGENADTSNMEDFCLPAVFMPYKSPNNVYNPRAYQYFHPSGSSDFRVTQPPSVIQLPPLPPKPTLSVINLYELGERYQARESDYLIKQLVPKVNTTGNETIVAETSAINNNEDKIK